MSHGPRRPSHIVFDLDGTLVDSIPGIDQAASAAVAEIAPELVLPPLRSFTGPPIKKMLQNALKINDADLLARLEQRFRHHYDGGAWRNTRPFPGTETTLKELERRGCNLFILTNKPLVPTTRILDYLGWTPTFKKIITPQSGPELFTSKTEGALYLKRLGNLPPTQTILVGDSEDDMLAAGAAGFYFTAASWGYGTVHRCDSSTRSLTQLSEILELTITI